MRLCAVTANGQPLRCYGRKRVSLCTEKGVLFSVNFAVMDVSQTILSVGELHEKGHEVIFGKNSCLRAGGEDVPLIKVGNLTYVEVMVLPENA
eukprot:2432658-Heterocapsa_arctica.AAC.1